MDVVAYEDTAEGLMPESPKPMRITQIRLRPRIVARASDRDRVRRVVEKANEAFITNTLNAERSSRRLGP